KSRDGKLAKVNLYFWAGDEAVTGDETASASIGGEKQTGAEPAGKRQFGEGLRQSDPCRQTDGGFHSGRHHDGEADTLGDVEAGAHSPEGCHFQHHDVGG